MYDPSTNLTTDFETREMDLFTWDVFTGDVIGPTLAAQQDYSLTKTYSLGAGETQTYRVWASVYNGVGDFRQPVPEPASMLALGFGRRPPEATPQGLISP